ncbi:hypothetical protein BDZ94DRAFT_1171981 [Collybia nuda]|uniref:Uncharacterized protein n=1 Tax=Collybia nuda TaxID=64659 RepID=A0A9P6CBB7_9AGAR|nr:hypothetical protein BDZ94DRAFT_1171981 [Collybia nuda]
MSEYSQDHPPEIPLRKVTPPLEQLGRSLLLSGFILRPRLAPVPARLTMLSMAVGLQTLVGYEPWEYKYRFYMQFLEGA